MSPGSPRTLTTSPQMALFHRFLARWSAFWVLRPSGRPLDGGNCTTRGCDTPATHRLRASCSAKPPPPPSWSAPAGPEGPVPVPMSGKSPATGPKGGPLPVQNSPSTPPSHRMCGTKLSQHESHGPTSGTKLSPHEPRGPTSGTKLSLLAQNGSIWHFFYMQGEFYTVAATKKPSRENFVPNASQRSSGPTQQHTRPHWCGGHRRVRREWRPGGPGRSTRE